MSTAIIALGLLYFTGHVLTHVFDKTRIPDVLILIIFGIIIGPVFQIVSPATIGPAGDLFTSIALIIILFEGGLGLEITTLVRSASQALKITVSFFFITAVVIFCILHWGFNFSPMASIVTGFICGGTSSAIIIPMINALKIGKEASTILIIESALTDVLCIIFTLGVLSSINSGEFEIGRIIGNLISSLVLASFIGAIGGLVWLRILKWLRQYNNTQFSTFAFMFIVYGIAESLHFSGPIAALAFGIILGNYRLVTHFISQISSWIDFDKVGVVSGAEKTLYKEIVFLLKIFFFVYLGISIPFERIYVVGVSLSIVLALYALRPLATKILVKKLVSPRDSMVISVMIPKGLAAAVLASLPSQYGMVEGNDIQAITYDVVLFSIIINAILILCCSKTPLGRLFKHFFGEGKKITTTPKAIEEK